MSPFTERTPAELGYYMPAEWVKHEATWFSWPHNEETWPEVFSSIPIVFAEIVFHLAQGEKVKINVLDSEHEAEVRKVLEKRGVNMENVQLLPIPTNDTWCRDHGPTFLLNKNGKDKAFVNWDFNSWGSKYPFELDNAVPSRIQEYEKDFYVFQPHIVMEGGSIEVNGAGTVLTTKACLLNDNRNPELSQSDVEEYLRQYLGVQQILWLEDGIVGDDTNGHIDDLSRFVDENTIITIVEENKEDENYPILEENLHLLQSMQNLQGDPFRILTLPMPSPVVLQGLRLPASYANFYIGNEVVLVPTFQDKNDQKALDILQECFPTRKVVGINCRELVLGLGTLHCISQQEPRY
jgi:agmatine deiminase